MLEFYARLNWFVSIILVAARVSPIRPEIQIRPILGHDGWAQNSAPVLEVRQDAHGAGQLPRRHHQLPADCSGKKFNK